MSTRYDLVCLQHGERMGFSWNHGAEQLQKLVRCRRAFQTIGQEMATGWNASLAEFVWLGPDGDAPGPYDIADFFNRHEGCTILPKDEYGLWANQCDRTVRCPQCGSVKDCVRERLHDGACAAEGQRADLEREVAELQRRSELFTEVAELLFGEGEYEDAEVPARLSVVLQSWERATRKLGDE